MSKVLSRWETINAIWVNKAHAAMPALHNERPSVQTATMSIHNMVITRPDSQHSDNQARYTFPPMNQILDLLTWILCSRFLKSLQQCPLSIHNITIRPGSLPLTLPTVAPYYREIFFSLLFSGYFFVFSGPFSFLSRICQPPNMTPWPPEIGGKQVIGLFSPCSRFHSCWNDNFYLRILCIRQRMKGWNLKWKVFSDNINLRFFNSVGRGPL